MKVKILDVYERNNSLVVETECEFGKDKLGLSIQQKYLDPITEKPKYLKEIKKLLDNKYNKKLANKKQIKDAFIGKEIDLDTI